MATQSNLKNMALVLLFICLGASAAVAVVYAVTKEPIELAEAANVNEAIKQVVPACNNDVAKDTLSIADPTTPSKMDKVYLAKKDGQIVGYAIPVTTTKGFGGAFSLMVGFTPDGAVYNTAVINHQETPGLGAKITDPNQPFIKQWKGMNLINGSVKIAVKKDGGDIDAITASTISSRAFCDAMQQAADIFNNINSEKSASAAEAAPADSSAVAADSTAAATTAATAAKPAANAAAATAAKGVNTVGNKK
ncbi:MAG TPA: RnfABCDGE type electron transport complex subunit G [Candidatus Egerieousia sp.]|nr:RnfABCDGE type electron transport complex subunit G [Candidatus Egerieousia sp.]